MTKAVPKPAVSNRSKSNALFNHLVGALLKKPRYLGDDVHEFIPGRMGCHAPAALPPLAACALRHGRCAGENQRIASLRPELMMQQCQEYEDRDWYSKQPQQD
jgi:hypothetical protein